jgi:hypothetical protein
MIAMSAFWDRIIYADIEVKHDCDRFAVVLCWDGEKDLMICRKCGNGRIVLCHVRGKLSTEK